MKEKVRREFVLKSTGLRLFTVNKYLNLLLLSITVDVPILSVIGLRYDPEEYPITFHLSTIFKTGYVYRWPHIALLDRLGF